MTTYQILIADPLLSMGMQWPPGVHLVSQGEPGPAGTHWHTLDDPQAPPGLEGRQVELSMRRGEDGSPEIASRWLILTHECPEDDGDGRVPCCGLPVPEIPRADRITGDKAAVTCEGPPAEGSGDLMPGPVDITVAYLACGCVVWLSDRTVLDTTTGPRSEMQCPRCRRYGMRIVAQETRTAEAVTT